MQTKQQCMYLVKQLRRELGMTQDDLAKKFSTTRSYISKIENGKMSETLEMRVKSFLMLECAEMNVERIKDKISGFDVIVGVVPVLSKCGQFFSYEFHTTFGVALIKHTAIDNKFFVSHKPISVEKELLVLETRKANEIVKVLNA